MNIKDFDYYLDYKDKDWNSYVSSVLKNIDKKSIPEKLGELLGDTDLSIVIYHHLEDNSMEWLYYKTPALHDYRPIDFIGSKKTVAILKGMLMRIH